jgi:predicted RNA binding protein YcfA (HicA-like mRNA interferase family)
VPKKFKEVRRLLRANGWTKVRQAAPHETWQSADGNRVVIVGARGRHRAVGAWKCGAHDREEQLDDDPVDLRIRAKRADRRRGCGDTRAWGKPAWLAVLRHEHERRTIITANQFWLGR